MILHIVKELWFVFTILFYVLIVFLFFFSLQKVQIEQQHILKASIKSYVWFSFAIFYYLLLFSHTILKNFLK